MQTATRPVNHAPIGRAALAIERHLGRHFPSLAADIAQEAWVVGLEMAPRYDPAFGPPEPYFYRGMLLHTAAIVHKWISATSISRAIAKAGGAGSLQRRVEVSDANLVSNFPDAVALLEAAEDAAELARRLSSLRVTWRREVERATRGLPRHVRAAGDLAIGVDGPPLRPKKVALQLGVWREDAERAVSKYNKRISGTPAARMSREVRALEAALS